MGLGQETRKFLVDEIGHVDALLNKMLLVPKSTIIYEESHCNQHLYEKQQSCCKKTLAELEVIVALPKMLIFYVGQ